MGFAMFFWIGAIVLFTLVEILTVGLVSIWFVAGAVVALVVQLLGAELWLQVTLFLLVSILLLVLTKPWVKRHFNRKLTPTNVDMLIGQEALVTEAIDNLRACGAATVGGKVWTARSVDAPIPAGSTVTIVRIEGVRLIVTPHK